MKSPCSRNDKDGFEEDSQGLISICVYKSSNGKAITDRITKVKNAKHEIHLLLVEQENNFHHVLIKYLSKMVGCQHNKNIQKKQIRPHCLRGFQSIDTLNKHFEHGCLAIAGQRIQMQTKGGTIHFKNEFRKFEAPYLIYADFECLTMEYSPKAFEPIDPNIPYTEKYQHHQPCGYKLNVTNRRTNESETYLYRGSDCMELFVKTCVRIKDQIMDKLKVDVPIIMTEEDEDNFNNATQCYLCEMEIENNNHIQRGCKVRDHCHMTGKYRGCAHNPCSLHFNIYILHLGVKTRVFLHNLFSSII